jgi:hypothetical protein
MITPASGTLGSVHACADRALLLRCPLHSTYPATDLEVAGEQLVAPRDLAALYVTATGGIQVPRRRARTRPAHPPQTLVSRVGTYGRFAELICASASRGAK